MPMPRLTIKIEVIAQSFYCICLSLWRCVFVCVCVCLRVLFMCDGNLRSYFPFFMVVFAMNKYLQVDSRLLITFLHVWFGYIQFLFNLAS